MSNANIAIKIPELDSEAGLRLYDGDAQLYIQALRLFVSNMPETINKMRGVSADTLHDYSISVHSLKGMCGYIGAEEARKATRQLEDLAKNGDMAGILAGNENHIKYIEKIIGYIQVWLDKEIAVEPFPKLG